MVLRRVPCPGTSAETEPGNFDARIGDGRPGFSPSAETGAGVVTGLVYRYQR
jgi:hypothetical protein